MDDGVWPVKCSCNLLETNGLCPLGPQVGDLPRLSGRHNYIFQNMGKAPCPPMPVVRPHLGGRA